jgi:hypothetical protein
MTSTKDNSSSDEIRKRRIATGNFFLIDSYFLELELMKGLSPNQYKFTTFETVLGMYVRVS